MTALSIVFGFRDRDVQRVERCLASLAQQTFTDFEVLFVDYGSQPQTAKAVQKVVEQHAFARYIYTETRGYPWNRSHALNIAGKQAQGEYILTNDVDMIFLSNFIEVVMNYASPRRELHISPYWLPESFADWENVAAYQGRLERIGKAGRGICLISTAVFSQIRGYDEYYRYYGVEDRDMSVRLQQMGLIDYWIDNETALFHQWHPIANYNVRDLIPEGVIGRMEKHFHHYQHEILRNDDSWGKLYTRNNRPVLSFVDADKQILYDNPKIHLVDLQPTKIDSINILASLFRNEVPSGHAVAINHAFFSQHTRRTDFTRKLANRLLYRISRGTQIDYSTNELHSFVLNLVEPPAIGIADYYLNLPMMDGVNVIVKE